MWSYARPAAPRFAGAPTLIETARSPERPDFAALPSGSEVRVEFYGGAYSLWMDGERRRVYVRRFEYVSFPTEVEARHAFLTLWREVEYLKSAVEVERASDEWMERWKRKRAPATQRNTRY